MRTQENKEKYKEYDHKYYIKNKRPKTKTGQLESQIDQLKQQLAEKQNTIDEINKEFVQSVKDWKALCAEKDTRIAELEDKDWYEACIKQLEEQNDRLIDTLKEKDKEIEKLKQQYTILENENGKLTTELIMDKYKKAQKEVSFGKQLAIQELEKVKMLTEWKFESIADVVNQIDQQIKELKGENDDTDN